MPMSVLKFRKGVIGKIGKKLDIKESNKSHKVIQIWYNDKRILDTHYSHGSSGENIDNNILSKIRKQLKLDNMRQLYKLEECSMSEDEYFNLLKEKNVISD